MKSSRLVGFLVCLTGAIASACGSSGTGDNLLSVEKIEGSFGAIREQKTVDGIIPAAGAPIDDFSASLLLAPGANIVFRIDPVEAVELLIFTTAEGVKAEISDGVSGYEEVDLHPESRLGGLIVLRGGGFPRKVEGLRLSSKTGSSGSAVGEVVLREDRSGLVPLSIQEPSTFAETIDRLLAEKTQRRRLSGCLGLVALPLLYLAFIGSRGWRHLICICLTVAGMASWLGFGAIHGEGRLLHPWELSHYFIGAKYFDELRYQELYRCIAEHEIEQGRSFMLERFAVRDLESNEIRSGLWTTRTSELCRASFSTKRRLKFGEDVDGIRRLFRYRHFHSILRDHGYNATPMQSMVLGWILSSHEPHRQFLLSLAILDIVLLFGSIALIWWAFGPLSGAIAALIVGLGLPWELSWTAGSIGRYFWLASLVGGMVLLRKRRVLAGSALLAVSGLLRLFPLVFLLGPSLRLIRGLLSRNSRLKDRLFVASVAIVLLVGILLPAAQFGGEVYAEFIRNSTEHASRPPGNDLGLAALLAGLPEVGMPDTSSGAGEVPERGGSWRKVVWALGLFLALIAVVKIEGSGIPQWETVIWSGLVLGASLPLSGYDYAWLILLAPVLSRSVERGLAAVFFLALTSWIPEMTSDLTRQFFWINTGMVTLLLLLAFDELRVLARRPLAREDPDRGRSTA